MTTDPPPAPAADTSAFSARQRADAYPPGIGAHYWLLSRNRIVASALRAAGAAAPLLDVGCGSGATVGALRASGFDCWGADLSRYVPDTPALGEVIWYGQDACALPADVRLRFRTLLLLDVLEHLAAPAEFLRRAGAAFPHLGHVVITLPARQELWSNYDAYYGHHRRYDRAAALALCAEAGLEVLRCDYLFHLLYPALRLQRLLGGDRPVRFTPIRHRWAHRLLASVLQRDAAWLPGRLPGTSLLLVARR